MEQTPETQGIIRAVMASGAPYRVTSTTGGTHAPGSYHYKGLAVDFAGPQPSVDSPDLLAIYNALRPYAPRMRELIYSGPGGGFWRNGVKVAPYAAAAHRNHIHAAVGPGTVLLAEAKAIEKMADVIKATAPVVAAFPSPSGMGYTLVTADGAVYCFGDARYEGRIEAPAHA